MRVGVALCAVLLAGCRLGFDVPSDASDGDAPSVAMPVLTDDFEDGALSSQWYFYNPSPPETHFVQTGGELQFTIPATLTSSFAGVTTPSNLDLTGKALWTELAAPPPSADGAVSYMTFGGDGGYLRLQTAFSSIAVSINDAEVARITPSSFNDMRWWRIREAAGEVMFEIGSDGRTWTEVHRVPAPAYTRMGGLNIGCGTFSAHAVEEQWRLRGVGVPPP